MIPSLQIPWPRWHRPLGTLRDWLRPSARTRQAADSAASWRRDPLAHPALRSMTQRELGDLPFDPRGVAGE